MFKAYWHDLLAATDVLSTDKFLVEEISLLEEASGVSLPNFLPHSVFLNLLQTCVYSFAERSRDLAVQACDYLDRIICRVIDPQLQASSRRTFQALIDRKRDKCIRYVEDAKEMQKSIVYTENPSYSKSLQKMQQWKESFIEVIRQNHKAVKIDVCLCP
ncbi:hypothetical protein KI387_011763, partial [Taxus chinensis]